MKIAAPGGCWVQWWPQTEPIGHHLLVSTPDEGIVDIDIEVVASELAEAVRKCDGTHHGHGGHPHTQEDAENAYNLALWQLLNHDYVKEHQDQERRRFLYNNWGFHAPAAVFVPDEVDPRQWYMVMPDKAGDPVTYKVDPKKLGIGDSIPVPHAGNAVRTDRGWEAIPPPETVMNRRLRRQIGRSRRRGS